MSAGSELPPASVILASRNRPDLLADTVRSILAGDDLPTELIVVDQSDRPHPVLRQMEGEIRYLWSESRGLSRANNLGARAAQHDLLVFTHDDVLVAPDWYARLLGALLREGPRSVVTGRVLPAEPETPSGFAPSINPATEPAAWEGRIGRDVLWPMNMAMHRNALESVNGFDERLGPGTPYPAAEDNDLGHRLLAAGHRIVFDPTAVLWHRAWRKREEHTALRYAYGRGQGAFYAKHLDLRDRYMLRRLAGDVLGRLARLPARAVREGRRPRDDFAYVRGVLSALWEWSKTERAAS
jgi:O-antigen biosynthesis protein